MLTNESNPTRAYKNEDNISYGQFLTTFPAIHNASMDRGSADETVSTVKSRTDDKRSVVYFERSNNVRIQDLHVAALRWTPEGE
ncbi:uncharacterized protein J4E87_005821 [Alternaria ethzedia]|uniref:uncharacterized protein n=1 Tax=Alternaria ethzedia TaxID=181014 RepID=UPI0020C47F19|nr:uncharacterized protein J4E87_005821 [Alternaria ethzedia]KAI4624320.1 hypothetical protein J4E87_005821 [Alternaria ethzedia]